MARPEVLDRIKEAETEADEIIATAESDADERLAEARQRAGGDPRGGRGRGGL